MTFKNFKVDDKVIVVSQSWDFPELVGKEAIVRELFTIEDNSYKMLVEFISFSNDRLHSGDYPRLAGKFKRKSCWYFYEGRSTDMVKKVPLQLNLFD